MLVFLTVCTKRQFRAAHALHQSIQQTHPDASFVLCLADALPSTMTEIPAALWPINQYWEANDLARRSAQYTPAEFIAATKPTFIRAVFDRFIHCDTVVYVSPTTLFYQPITDELARNPSANLLLTPYLTQAPNDGLQPDEKHLQNIGLYTSDLLVFRRSDATKRFLAWWEHSVADRAFIDPCEGLCLDQIWLMHAPAFLDSVAIVTTPGWNIGLWNLHETPLIYQPDSNQWLANGVSAITSVNFCGLTNADEGLFPYQTRFVLANRPDVQQFLADQQAQLGVIGNAKPVYGQRPELPVLRGWRKKMTDRLRYLTNQIETAPVPDQLTKITDRVRGLTVR
jgi:hypothetical protein